MLHKQFLPLMSCQFSFVNVQLQIPDLCLDVSEQTCILFKHSEHLVFSYFLSGMLEKV